MAFDWDKPPVDLPLRHDTGIRVLWWNIQFGQTDREIKSKTGNSALSGNLLELASSDQAPEIIILGEYEETSLEPTVLEKLRERYPESPEAFWPYNPNTPERGIGVFSRIPIVKTRTTLLDYFPLEMRNPSKIREFKSAWAEDFPPERFFPRTYLNIAFKKGAETFHIVPFHALIHVEKEFRESGGGFFITNWIKLKMTFGTDNPMIYQLKRLRNEMKSDFGPALDSPFLMIGDFNLPKKLFGLTTAAYSVISRNLTDLFKNSTETTWPLPSSKEFKEFSIRAQIDHAFCSGKLSCSQATILPFKGSDHAALMVDLQHSN